MLSPSPVMPAARGFQRNFPEAPGGVTGAGKEGGVAGRRGGEGAGKAAASCFLSRHPHAPWLPQRRSCGGKRERVDVRILLCTVSHSGAEKKRESLEKSHLAPRQGPAGWVGTAGLLPSAAAREAEL